MTEYSARAIELAEQLHEKARRNLEAYEREERDLAERAKARSGDREPHAKVLDRDH